MAESRATRDKAFDLCCAVAATGVGVGVALSLSPWRSRGFYLDEGWRASAVSYRDVWRGAATNDTPLSLGFMLFARARLLLFGSSEGVLRADPLLLIPVLALVTYLLARKAVPALLAFAAAAAVVLQTTIVNYATQFKQYVGEATASVLVVLLWIVVVDPTRPRRTRLLAAVGVGVLPLYSTPSIFIVGALAVCWWVRELRHRGVEARERAPLTIGLSAISLVPGVVHAAVFLRHQVGALERNAGADLWDSFFVPRAHPSEIPHWLVRMAQTWVPGVVTDAYPVPHDAGPPLVPVHGATAWLVGSAMVIALVGAVLLARRSSALRWTVAAFFGTQGVVLLLAAVDVWPLGFSRANLFLLPCFVVLLVSGAWYWIDVLLAQLRTARDTHGIELARVVSSSVLVLVVVAGAVASGVIAARGDADVRTFLDEVLLGQGTGVVAQEIATWCTTHDVVVTEQQQEQAQYYFRHWAGTADVRLPRHHLLLGVFEDPRVPRFLARAPGAARACLFEAYGVSGELHDRDLAPFSAAGYVVPITTFGSPGTGLVTVLGRSTTSG